MIIMINGIMIFGISSNDHDESNLKSNVRTLKAVHLDSDLDMVLPGPRISSSLGKTSTSLWM